MNNWQGTFLPFGQEWNPQLTTNHYKFTGKERDSESNLDYFGARYYSSTMGRWLSPDWADKPEPVPYGDLNDPQSLNLYGYVRNNPMSHADADGHVALADDIIVAGVIGLYALTVYVSSPQGQETIKQGITAANGLLDMAAEKIRSIPNPWGSKGAPDHQEKVHEEADKARAEADAGETVLEGQKVQGVDSTRRPDVQVVGADGETKTVTEVERRPGSKRHKERQKEYDKLKIPNKTVPVPPRPKPEPKIK